MNENESKLYEITINENGIRFRRANPNPLSADQKFTIIMVLIGLAALLGFFGFLTLSSVIKMVGR